MYFASCYLGYFERKKSRLAIFSSRGLKQRLCKAENPGGITFNRIAIGHLSRIGTLIIVTNLLLACQSSGDNIKSVDEGGGNIEGLEKSVFGTKIRGQDNVSLVSGALSDRLVSSAEREPSLELLSLVPAASGSEENTMNRAGLLEIDLDTRGMTLESFFSSIAENVLGLNFFADESLDLSGSAPTIFMRGPVAEGKIIDALLRTSRANGFYSEIVDGTFFLLPEAAQSSSVRIGIGASESSVPNGSDDILQIVPLKNDWSIEIDRLVSELSGVQLSRSSTRNAYVLRGNRQAVIRSLQIIDALDVPSIVGSHITLVPLTFLEPEDAAREVQTLLSAEGIRAQVGRGPQSDITSSILLLPMQRLQGLLVFSAQVESISRVEYWLNLIDIPAEGADRSYFIFKPRRISARDLLQSFSLIFTESNNKGGSLTGENSGDSNSTQQAPEPSPSSGSAIVTEEFRMIVDRNSGQIIINSSDKEYQKLLGILERLDISPRQVLLEVIIAEVSLKDEFRLGFEWALNNRGVSYSTVGGFGANSFSGLSINLSKDKLLSGKIFASDNLIRVLSSPTLLVKEGEQANVNVGSQISVVGQTTFDPLVGGQRQTTAAEYLSTGVSVSFRPTLIGSDVIDLDIEQKISNTVAGSVGAAGNPDVFNRELKTKVLAQSGQTVFLGGLISERGSSDNSGIPFISRVPLLGAAFGAQGSQSDRTELVMLVTPKIFENPEDWTNIYSEFRSNLRSIELFEPMIKDKRMKGED